MVPNFYMLAMLSFLYLSGLATTPLLAWQLYLILPHQVPFPRNPKVPPLSPFPVIGRQQLYLPTKTNSGQGSRVLERDCIYALL